jgi:hypothetical protein
MPRLDSAVAVDSFFGVVARVGPKKEERNPMGGPSRWPIAQDAAGASKAAEPGTTMAQVLSQLTWLSDDPIETAKSLSRCVVPVGR